MNKFLIRPAQICRGSRKKGGSPVGKYGAIILINGVKFTSEEPINETHASYINGSLEELKRGG